MPIPDVAQLLSFPNFEIVYTTIFPCTQLQQLDEKITHPKVCTD